MQLLNDARRAVGGGSAAQADYLIQLCTPFNNSPQAVATLFSTVGIGSVKAAIGAANYVPRNGVGREK